MDYDKTCELCLKEMFKRVGEKYPNKKLTDQKDWYMQRSWSEKEEKDFSKWMDKTLKKRHPLLTKKGRVNEIGMFMLTWGWKIEEKKKILRKRIYKIKPNKAQMDVLRRGWKQFKKDYDFFWECIQLNEKWMSKETGIEGIEIFKDDMCGDWCGIGNADRTLRLIQREELE